MSEEKKEPRIAQVLSCKCGVQYAAACYPYPNEDKHWLKEVEECAKAGGTMANVDVDKVLIRLYQGTCTCGLVNSNG